jgi:hypothetical protein
VSAFSCGKDTEINWKIAVFMVKKCKIWEKSTDIWWRK